MGSESKGLRTAVRGAVLLIATNGCAPAGFLPRTYGNPVEVGKSKISGSATNLSDCTIIYAWFVGAMETSDHKASGIVQIRDTLRGPMYADVCAKSFLPYNPSAGFEWVLTHFPSHSGPLSAEELQHGPRIILVGHSTGGWAMLSVARELRDKNIPVELTIQVDSHLSRPRLPDVHYHEEAEARGPLKTRIVANVLVKGAGHLSITRDPRIRASIVKTIERLLGRNFCALPNATNQVVPVNQLTDSTNCPPGCCSILQNL